MHNHNVKTVEDFVIVNDSVRKAIFGGNVALKPAQIISLTASEGVQFSKKTGKQTITSKIELKNLSNSRIVLTPFDAAVYDAVISEWLAGNDYTTSARIWHILGGDSENIPSAAMKKAIGESVLRMYHIKISVVPNADAHARYSLSEKYYGRILDFKPGDTKINGRETKAIQICGSVLFDIADAKNHIKRIPRNFFDLDIRHSEKIIVLLHYLIRRAAEISGANQARANGKKCRGLSNSILLASLYRDCGFEDFSRWERQDLRKAISEILDALKRRKFISGWEFEAEAAASVDDEGNEIPAKGNPAVRAIKLTFPRRPPTQPTPFSELTL